MEETHVTRHREERQVQKARQRTQRQPVVTPGQPGGQYKPLSQLDIERIHAASLTVLERTGIEVMPSEWREILRAAGTKVDDAANRVFIPRQMVEKALTLAPKAVRLYPHNADHRSRAAWEEASALDMREVARHKAHTILTTHQAEPIVAAVDATIRARWPIRLAPIMTGREAEG